MFLIADARLRKLSLFRFSWFILILFVDIPAGKIAGYDMKNSMVRYIERICKLLLNELFVKRMEKAKILHYPAGKFAEKAVRRSVFLTI